MSKEAAELLRDFAQAPLSVQREVTAALLAQQFGAREKSRARAREIAGKFTAQPNVDSKPHDAWFAEAIQASKRAETTE
jgi:hypothetical protein